MPPKEKPTLTSGATTASPLTPIFPTPDDTPHDHLWDLVVSTFQVLNASHPNLTTDCWLCLDVQLPF